MKIIITETQKKMLTESIMDWVRRRLNYDVLKPFVDNIIQEETTPCSDYGDEFEFADNVISRAIDDLLLEDEEIMNRLGDKYDEVNDLMVDHCKDLFGEELFDLYRDTCENYD